MRLFLAAAAALALAAPAAADHHTSADHAEHTASHAALMAAVADERRADDARRDEFRHPVETIEFFRIEPGMTVLDHFPNPGWYTRILAPYLGAEGRYIGGMTTLPFSSEDAQATQNAFPETFPARIRDAWGEDTGAPVTGVNTTAIPEEMNGTVDRVLIFRMMHNLHRWGLVHQELTALRGLLKEDGMLGIVQHRAAADAPYSYADGNHGYMRQEDVIKLVEAHGFELVATSEANANPQDPANWEDGVWTMPPAMAGDDAMDARVKDLGESDRMTLLFRKRP